MEMGTMGWWVLTACILVAVGVRAVIINLAPAATTTRRRAQSVPHCAARCSRPRQPHSRARSGGAAPAAAASTTGPAV